MIESLIKGWHTLNNKSRITLIESMLGDENFFRHEVSFFDEGRITSGIMEMENDYKKISTEIDFVKRTEKKSDETSARLNFLYSRQLEILQTVAFQSSQLLEKVSSCLKLLENLNLDFTFCLEGLQFYIDGDVDNARKKFDKYLSEHKNFGEHYQLNKIYGLIKFRDEDYESAKFYLQKVTQICPEDSEVHSTLAKIYNRLGCRAGEQAERKILKLLGGD